MDVLAAVAGSPPRHAVCGLLRSHRPHHARGDRLSENGSNAPMGQPQIQPTYPKRDSTDFDELSRAELVEVQRGTARAQSNSTGGFPPSTSRIGRPSGASYLVSGSMPSLW